MMAAASKYSGGAPFIMKAAGSTCGNNSANTLKPYAAATPSAINVNMFGERLTIERQPSLKKNAPHQRTTGVASASCVQPNHGPIAFTNR